MVALGRYDRDVGRDAMSPHDRITPERVRRDRKPRSAKCIDRLTCEFAQQSNTLTEILIKLLWRQGEQESVPVAVAANLVPLTGQSLDQIGVFAGNPADDQEGAAGARCVQKSHQVFGVVHHARRGVIPRGWIGVTIADPKGMKPFLKVYAKCIERSMLAGGWNHEITFPCSNRFTTFAGLPATTVNGGTSVVTTAPLTTTAARPTVTPGRRTALTPMKA